MKSQMLNKDSAIRVGEGNYLGDTSHAVRAAAKPDLPVGEEQEGTHTRKKRNGPLNQGRCLWILTR